MKRVLKILFVFAVCLALASCKKAKGLAEPAMALADGMKVRASKNMAMAESMDMDEDALFEAEYDSDASNGGGVQVEQKLIKNGSLSLEVQSLLGLEEKAESFAKKFGGYISNSNSSEWDFNCEIKIPSRRFEEAMAEAGSFGKILSRSENCRDVTDEFYDLESRINTKKILKVKLEGYLSSAKDIKDLLQIERQLNQVISELESMEGRMKRLSNQIDFSTLNMNALLPAGKNESGFVWPDLGDGFRQFVSNSASFFAGFLLFLFYLAAYGIPILALAAFLFWLLFGRVGLLIKLFKKLSGRK